MPQRPGVQTQIETRLAWWRVKRGVTKEALAPAVGISLTTLGSIERGTAAKVPIQYWINLGIALVRSSRRVTTVIAST